jgi:hypothetical protein
VALLKMQRPVMIDEKDARKQYPAATPEWKATLETTFGKEFFSQKITDRVKTFADACEVLEIDQDDIWDESDDQDEVAYKQLKVIVRALNEGWEPNYNNSNERKWYPWFYMDKPAGFRLDVCFYGVAGTTVGARLVFKSEELARYAATQFLGLYSSYYEL